MKKKCKEKTYSIFSKLECKFKGMGSFQEKKKS